MSQRFRRHDHEHVRTCAQIHCCVPFRRQSSTRLLQLRVDPGTKASSYCPFCCTPRSMCCGDHITQCWKSTSLQHPCDSSRSHVFSTSCRCATRVWTKVAPKKKKGHTRERDSLAFEHTKGVRATQTTRGCVERRVHVVLPVVVQ